MSEYVLSEEDEGIIKSVQDAEDRNDLYVEDVGALLSVVDDAKEIILDLRRKLAERDKENHIMSDFLKTLKQRAQNDINIRTRHGQHVGSLTFASIQDAREVIAVCEILDKQGGNTDGGGVLNGEGSE